jgi:hypothetical protein
MLDELDVGTGGGRRVGVLYCSSAGSSAAAADGNRVVRTVGILAGEESGSEGALDVSADLSTRICHIIAC